ncbi:hypothetical protein S40288_06416 [Stachybotrys chartarum IBT 40288]|nr:hypothetical protein S40288_06416 [Stachybotrys chartarum IBT 40288]
MSRQVEQALLSLMPTLGSDLPPPLVELAGSLLAQSRIRASALKPDEEVARMYACANLACDRMKISLDLPPIQPRPPIPPRLYKNLYTYLENILPKSTAAGRSSAPRIRTPSGKVKQAVGSPTSEERPLPSRQTPSKAESLNQFRTPSKQEKATPTRRTRKSPGNPAKAKMQPWIQPVIRFLCARTHHQTLAPAMLAGMEFVLIHGGSYTTDEWVMQNTTSLVAAIYFFVTMRARAITSGEAVDREDYVPQRKTIINLLQQARAEVTMLGMEDHEAWQDWTVVSPRDFDAAVERVNDKEWLQADWYRGITDIVQNSQAGDVSMTDAGYVDAPQEAVRRADTMFQDRYDLLSEARRAEYTVWKEDMLSRIAALTKEPGTMEVDSS